MPELQIPEKINSPLIGQILEAISVDNAPIIEWKKMAIFIADLIEKFVKNNN
jgi:hypothetical protein